jgi:hypothetical protein
MHYYRDMEAVEGCEWVVPEWWWQHWFLPFRFSLNIMLDFLFARQPNDYNKFTIDDFSSVLELSIFFYRIFTLENSKCSIVKGFFSIKSETTP